jgi:hypothetical protein
MSIEQKIAEILAESKKLNEAKFAGKEGGSDSTTGNAAAGDQSVIRQGDAVPATTPAANPDSARNNKDEEKDAEKAPVGTANPKNGDQSPVRKGTTSVKEDIDALMNGEELSEDFRTKATTIFEAAVTTRVAEEVARIEEEFEAKLAEQVEQNTQGIVEQVDGYLGYIAEQWIAQNEIALERGMKSEIMESFILGMKDLFEEHYVEIPEERYDVLGEMENTVAELEAKLNEQVEANVALTKSLSEAKQAELVKSISEGLTDTEQEKFLGLVEELSYEDAASFEQKLKTIRENYFTTKTIAEQSVVTDAPVEMLSETVAVKAMDPAMSAYLSVLNK